MGQETAEQLTVECSCGKRLKAPASAIGRRAKCPGCGNILLVEAPPPPPPMEESSDDFSALYELAAQESQAAERGETSSGSSMRCPSCTSPMAPGAVVCVHCGFDMRTRSKVKAKSAAAQPLEYASPRSKAPRAARAADSSSDGACGNYFLGVAFGLAAGIVGAVICFYVWYKAPQIPFTGWLALLVGAGAGWGVNAGYKAGTHFAGATAAAITFVIVVITKLIVLAALVAPVVQTAVANAAHLNRDRRVLHMLVQDEMKAQNVTPQHATFAQMERVEKAAAEKLEALPDSEYEAMVQKADENEDKDELIATLTNQELQSHNDTVSGARSYQIQAARDNATRRVEAMTPLERTAALAAANKQTQAEFEQSRAKFRAAMAAAQASASQSKSKQPAPDPNNSNGARLLGYALIMVIFLFLWTLLPSFVAMSLAWKIAADA